MTCTWSNELPVVTNLECTKNKLTEWNKQVFGNIFERKRRLIGELKRVQKVLDVCFSHKLQACEANLRVEIEEVLAHEELLCTKNIGRNGWNMGTEILPIFIIEC